jgi:hypothetical protein
MLVDVLIPFRHASTGAYLHLFKPKYFSFHTLKRYDGKNEFPGFFRRSFFGAAED